MNENIIAAHDLFDALAATLNAHDDGHYCSGEVGVMDVVWWQTGLSPAKYEAVQIPNMHAWKIVRRG